LAAKGKASEQRLATTYQMKQTFEYKKESKKYTN
jgi:hypothetical protein